MKTTFSKHAGIGSRVLKHSQWQILNKELPCIQTRVPLHCSVSIAMYTNKGTLTLQCVNCHVYKQGYPYIAVCLIVCTKCKRKKYMLMSLHRKWWKRFSPLLMLYVEHLGNPELPHQKTHWDKMQALICSQMYKNEVHCNLMENICQNKKHPVHN